MWVPLSLWLPLYNTNYFFKESWKQKGCRYVSVSCMMVADYCTTNYYILLLPGFLCDTLPIEAAQVAWPNHTHTKARQISICQYKMSA